MNINLILGKCSEQNNATIFNLLKYRDKSKKHIILAPDRSLFSLESRLFEELEEGCFFDVRVMSISKLAKEVMPKTEKKLISKQSGVALVKKLLKKNDVNLKSFGKSSGYMGFATSLFETICLYKSCNILPNDVYIDNSSSYSNLKQNDIKLIYSKYEEYFREKFTDSFNQMIAFAEYINAEIFKDTIFYFAEFDDMTSLMYNIILKLSKYSEAIYITCLFDKTGKNKNIYLNKVYYDLVSLYKNTGLYYNTIKLDEMNDSLKNKLLHNAFSYDLVDKIKCDEKIHINSFENIKDEVRYCVADIYSKSMNENVAFDEIAIVVPSINKYKKHLIDEFKNYNISYYFDENILLCDHPIIRLLFAITDMFDFVLLPDFLDVIKSPILNYNLDKILDAHTYFKSIDAKMNSILTYDYKDEDINIFIGVIAQLQNIEQVNSGQFYFDNIIQTIFQLIQSRYGEYLQSYSSMEMRIFNQVLTKFQNISDDFLSLFREVQFEKGEFLEVFKSYFESTNISLPPITSNTIFVADLDDSYISKYNFIYMLGCNEGVMPNYKSDNGILTDEDIANLPNGSKITPTISMINKRKLFKVFDCLFKWKNSLTLSFVLSDNGGNLFPNSLINTLSKNFDIKINNYSGIFESENYVYDVNENLLYFSNLTQDIVKNNIISMIRKWDMCNLFPSYRKVLSSLVCAAGIDGEKIIDNFNNKKSYSYLNNVNLFKNNKSSVSQIQNYYKCPYKHFIDYGLKLRDNEKSKIESVDIGNIIHDALKVVVEYLIKNNECNIDVIYKFANGALSSLLNQKYNRFIEDVSNRFIIKSLRKEFIRVVSAIKYEIDNSAFKPKENLLEVPFKNILSLDGITIDCAIDRVDILNDKFIIIDYKTGDNSFDDFTSLYYGKKLQLMIYAKVYEKISGKKCVGIFYFPISNELGKSLDKSYKLNGLMIGDEKNIVAMDSNLAISGHESKILNLKRSTTKEDYNSNNFKNNLCLNNDDFDFVLNFAIDKVLSAINQIKKGDISPKPLKDGMFSSCDNCKYKALCGYNGDNDENIVKIPSVNNLKEILGGEIDGAK